MFFLYFWMNQIKTGKKIRNYCNWSVRQTMLHNRKRLRSKLKGAVKKEACRESGIDESLFEFFTCSLHDTGGREAAWCCNMARNGEWNCFAKSSEKNCNKYENYIRKTPEEYRNTCEICSFVPWELYIKRQISDFCRRMNWLLFTTLL